MNKMLIRAIVDREKGAQVIKVANRYEAEGGIILLAEGTIKSKLLNFLAIDELEKDLVLFAVEENKAAAVLKDIHQTFHMEKPNHGIVYSIQSGFEEGENMSHVLLTAIIDKGRAEEIVDIAKAKGANGATILNARDSGTAQCSKVFGMDIEPEREVVMIIDTKEQIGQIVETLKEEETRLDGHLIFYVQPVGQVYGLFGQRP